MRNVWIVVASGLLAFANFVKSQETGQGGGGRTLYSSRYDNLDIDTILSSNRLVNNYVDCLLSRKPCPPEGKDLKRILPEALRTKCGRCSSTQKENALKIITTLYYSYPDLYQALRERWDPSGEYHRRFEEYLRGIQFNQIGGNGNGNGNNGNGPSERPQPTVGPLSNRFGDDDSGAPLSTTPQRPPVQTTSQRPVVVRQTTARPAVTQRTTSRFNQNGVGGGLPQSPIVGLFNQIGNKLATTADAIAGMLRKTVDVIVTSHIQSHQRALRSFGAQQ